MLQNIRIVGISILLCFSFLCLPAQTKTVSPESAGMSSERLVRLGNYLEDKIEKAELTGAVSMVMRKGKLVQYTSFGHQDVENKVPMKNDAIFYIQSMTKPIISVGIMMLYEEGHFELNDRVSKYLPQFKEMAIAQFDESRKLTSEVTKEESTITIAQLLSHTAGMLHGLSPADLDRKYAENLYFKSHKNISDRVEALASMPLVVEPGTAWFYSASPDVLALLIEHFSGMSAADFLQERLFDPLEMTSTGYNVVQGGSDRVVTLYQGMVGQKLVPSERQTPQTGNTIFGGTHGLFSTAGDYMKFASMMLNGGTLNGKHYLSKKTVELMTSNHVGDFRGKSDGFGLGFGVKTDFAAGRSLGSTGQFYWGGAFNTYFFIDPKEELVSILMMQFTPYTDFYSKKHQHFIYQSIID